MKRIIASILLVVTLLMSMTALTSCFGGGGKNLPDFVMPEGGFDKDTPIEITFYHCMGQGLQEALTYAVEDFKALYPNITVKEIHVSDYDGIRSQIKTEISVGDQPNLAICYPDHVALYNSNNANAVQSLDALIDCGIEGIGFTQAEKDNFIQGYYEEGTKFGDGKMYCFPLYKSTEVLYYNKTFFDANNLTVPTTWEEMEEVCRQIKAIEPTCIPLGYDSEANWFITMCEQYGESHPYTSATGENFLFNNDNNKAFVEEFCTWFQDGLVTTQTLAGSYTSKLFTGASSTKCYMCIGSTGGAGYQMPTYDTETGDASSAFEVGISPIPQVNPDAPKVISQGPSVCIFKKDNPQEVLASWLFLRFLATNEDFQGLVSMKNGYVPVIKSINENPTYKSFLENDSTTKIQARAVKVAVEQQAAYYSSPAFSGSSVARDEVGKIISECFGNSKDKNGNPVTPAALKAAIDKAFADAVAECKYQSGQ